MGRKMFISGNQRQQLATIYAAIYSTGLTNANIAANAAIALSKIAGMTVACAHISKSGADPQTIGSTPTDVTFDAEEKDTDAFHSTTSNTERFTIPTGLGGTYYVKFRVNCGPSTSVNNGNLFLKLFKNAAVIDGVYWSHIATAETYDVMLTVECIVDLAVGDYVKCQFRSDDHDCVIFGNGNGYGASGLLLKLK